MEMLNLAPAPRTHRAPLDPDPARRIWTINVLMVDDDAADTSLVVDVLRRHPGVSSVRASDDPEGMLEVMDAGRLQPDLVLLDINMPRMDGFTFLRRMRHIPAMASRPVVFLTTSKLGRDAEEARYSSAVSYVVKPDTYVELQTRLDTVVRKTIAAGWIPGF
jgi:two-component system chemotaxis response regulator CheY